MLWIEWVFIAGVAFLWGMLTGMKVVWAIWADKNKGKPTLWRFFKHIARSAVMWPFHED